MTQEALRRASARFVRRRGETPPAAACAPPWDAAHFGLEGAARFREAPEAARRAVLDECARALVAESWQVEKCGIDFCARMVGLSESVEEKRLYALIGADEATHSCWLEPWMEGVDRAPDPFNRFIAGLSASGARQPLAFLLQGVLEGFGIVHYAHMGDACRDPGLAATLKRMSQDEAMHHAAGLELFDASRLGPADRAFTLDGAHAFLEMIRVGPQAVAGALDRAVGLGGAPDIAGVFAELDAEARSAGKLERLRHLMARPGMEWLVAQLDAQRAFTPCTAGECARFYAGTR